MRPVAKRNARTANLAPSLPRRFCGLPSSHRQHDAVQALTAERHDLPNTTRGRAHSRLTTGEDVPMSPDELGAKILPEVAKLATAAFAELPAAKNDRA